jgi:hypothetical protein
MRKRYVFPGCSGTDRSWVSLSRAELGTGSAPVGLALLMKRLSRPGIWSWYQSDTVMTRSSSYMSLKGDAGSWTMKGPRRPSGYWPWTCEWYQYVPGWST